MRRTWLSWLLVVAPAPAVAQPASLCELHVWPAAQTGALPFAPPVGALTAALVHGRASKGLITSNMADLVSPASQLAALRAINLIGPLHLTPGTRVITHDDPVDVKTVKQNKIRRASSTSPCYAELLLTNNDLIEDIVWGDRFISGFTFRNFIEKPMPIRSINGRGGNKLKVLTLKPEARPPNARELAQAAVQANFREFAKNIH